MEQQKNLDADTPGKVSLQCDEIVKKEWKQPTISSLNIKETQAIPGPGTDNFERAIS